MATRKALVFGASGRVQEMDSADTLAGAAGATVSYLGGGTLPRPGQWFHTPVQSLTTTGYPGLYASPFSLGKTATVTAAQFRVETAPSAATPITVGIYADDGSGSPGKLVADFGSVSITATGVQTLTLATGVSLGPGQYWLALGMPNAYNGIAVTSSSGYNVYIGNQAMGWASPWGNQGTVGLWNSGYSGGALPSPFGSYSYQGPGGGSGPVVLVKFA